MTNHLLRKARSLLRLRAAAIVPFVAGLLAVAARWEPVRPAGRPPVRSQIRVRSLIDEFCRQDRESLETALERAGRYETMIRSILREEGLPEELLYVAMLESAFRPSAQSSANACGLWQFIPATGNALGLRRSPFVDERANPMKSTRAAARYWKSLHRRFRNWDLALAAYNAGETRVASAIHEAHTRNFWKLCVIALVTIARDPAQYGISYDAAPPLEYATLTLDRPVDLRRVARRAKIDVRELRRLNPELRTDWTPKRADGYHLLVPARSRFTIEDSLTEGALFGSGDEAVKAERTDPEAAAAARIRPIPLDPAPGRMLGTVLQVLVSTAGL
jgi:membrane-bound lytic murein transglycosylase D